MYFDVFADFFFGFFIFFAHTLGFSGVGQGYKAKSYNCCPTDSDYSVHLRSFINEVIFSWMALAQNGCGKFQPTNAPTAIHNIVSNILRLLKFQGVVVAPVHQKQAPVLI